MTDALTRALGARHLLLDAADLRRANDDVVARGERLLAAFVEQRYPLACFEGRRIRFGSEADAQRLGAALAFGAVAAEVLAAAPVPEAIGLLCAEFNLGIGLVDSLCDERPPLGHALLAALQSVDLGRAAEVSLPSHGVRASWPPLLAGDAAAAFAAEVIEAFFETLQLALPGVAGLAERRAVGAQLRSALAAEQGSVAGRIASREQLRAYSRLTSVLPFEIIGGLSGGPAASRAATSLGLAMWRIDDLVDLRQDLRTGALNGVLLGIDAVCATPADALATLLAGATIETECDRAADDLAAGLGPLPITDGAHAAARRAFLGFVQGYAGLSSPAPS